MSNFKSLSAAINTRILQAQNDLISNIKISSPTMANIGPVKSSEQILNEDQNTLTWGISTWGLQKVTSFYKPNN